METKQEKQKRQEAAAVASAIESGDFYFIGIGDGGTGCCCPHCGAEGRWVYQWCWQGKKHSAMAGCYKVLTRSIPVTDERKFWEQLSTKLAKGKELSGWDKNIMNLNSMRDQYGDEWVDKKIQETLNKRRTWAATKRW